MLGPHAPTPAEKETPRQSIDVVQPAPRANAYVAGRVDRLSNDWVPRHRSADAAIAEGWDLLTARVRDLVRNEPALQAARRALVDQVVGTGLSTTAAVILGKNEQGLELDDEFNEEVDELFDHWADYEADAEGRLSWGDMQRMIVGETCEVGEILVLRCLDSDPNRFLPLCYQLLESEQLDATVDRPSLRGENAIVRGVELDSRRRPVAYYLYGVHPYDTHGTFTSHSERVPAERLIHHFVPFRPSQSRGVSWFTACIRTARDKDNLFGNVLTAAAVQSIFTVVHKAAYPDSGIGMTDAGADVDDNGNPLTRLGRGTIATIGPQDSIDTIQPTHPAANLSPFVDLILQELSMAAGASYLRLTRNYSKTNYSSARAAHNDDDKSFRPISNHLGKRVVMPVRREWTAQAAALGRLRSVSPRLFAQQRQRWLRAELITPGRGYIEPVVEIEGALKRIAGGISTHKDEIAQFSGKSFRRVFRQLKLEKDYANELELEFVLTNTGSPPARGDDAGGGKPGKKQPANAEVDDAEEE